MQQTNNHLKARIKEVNNFLKNHTKPPEDLCELFFQELELSKMLIPSILKDNMITFDHLESDDGLEILPLYTDEDEYHGDKDLLANLFSYYADIVRDCQFKGIVINPDSDEFFIGNRIVKNFEEDFSDIEAVDDAYGPVELKQAADNLENRDLTDFIRDDSNFNNFDGLLKILEGKVLINVVSSRRDLSEFAREGILTTLEVGGFDLSVKRTGKEKFGILFTNLEAIRLTCDTNAGVNYYYQITALEKILFFIITNDLDGLVINPYLDDYFVPRNVLLDMYFNHPEIVKNSKFIDGMFFSFVLD